MPELGDPRAYLAVLGVLILIMTVFRMGRRRVARLAREAAEAEEVSGAQTPRDASPDGATTQRGGASRGATSMQGASEARKMSEDLSQVLVQIQEVTREVEARLDNRIRYARGMMEEAEQTLDTLSQKLHEARGLLAAGDETPARRVPPAAVAAAYRTRKAAAPATSPVKAKAPTKAEAPLAAATPPVSNPVAGPSPMPASPQIQSSEDGLSAPPSPESQPSPKKSKPKDDSRDKAPRNTEIDRIGRLAAQGKTPAAIAREIERPIGEVELMLGLHRQANDGNSP